MTSLVNHYKNVHLNKDLVTDYRKMTLNSEDLTPQLHQTTIQSNEEKYEINNTSANANNEVANNIDIDEDSLLGSDTFKWLQEEDDSDEDVFDPDDVEDIP